MANNNQFKIKKLIGTINRKFLVTISRKSIYLILNKYNSTYKKASFNSRKSTNMQHIKNVKELKHNIDNINNKFISIDEMAIYTNVNRRRGWSMKGERTTIKRALHGTKKRTLITAISNALRFNRSHIN